jgi:hypothetical protein
MPDVTTMARIALMLRARPLVSFFVFSYAVTWLLWAPLVFAGVPAFSCRFGVLILCVVTALALVVLTRRLLGYTRYRHEAEHLDIGKPTTPKVAAA